MLARQRFRLIFGTYSTPRFRYSARVWDEARGWVKIVGLTNGRIPWPKGRRGQERGAAIVVYGDLAKAVRLESNLAVAHWWGVTGQTVTRWRKALDVGRLTDGTTALMSAYGHTPANRKSLRKAVAKARDPGRRAKIAAARRGKTRPLHVVEAVRKAHLGTRHTAEARRKMSDAHRRRGTRPPWIAKPWTAAEDRLLRTLSPADVVEKTGRTLRAVYQRRQVLGLPDGRYRSASQQL